MTDARQSLGAQGERAAERFLRRQGYTIVERNYRCRAGEIDLIALDGPVIVFVEVKTRTGLSAGVPFEAVTTVKQRQLARVAAYYVNAHRLHEREARFDVVGVWWENATPRCEVIRAAFEVP